MSGGALDQAAIDALMNQPKTKPAPEPSSATSDQEATTEASGGGALDQAAIDALMNQQKAAPETSAGGSLDQSAIDALMNQQQEPAGTEAQNNGALDQSAIDALMNQPSAAPEPSSDSGALDQAAIDALMNQQATPATPEPSDSGALDQSAIDALMNQPSAAPEPPSDSGALDQAAIDALMNQQSAAATPPAAEALGDLLDQDGIDALIARHATGEIPRSAPPEQADLLARVGLPEVEGGMLDQNAVDALIQQTPTAAPPPAKRVDQVPNPLGARTIDPRELGGKMVRSWTNPEVTRVRRSRFFLPEQVQNQNTAIEAIERLFTLANAFRDGHGENQANQVATVPNRFGQQTTIAVTRDRAKPVHIQIDGIQACNSYQKFVETSHTYRVDRFTPNQGSLSKHWVDWFTTHYDPDTLANLSNLT